MLKSSISCVRSGYPATLFMGGKWMRSHSERAMQLMADPLFEIGNHGWSHGNFGIMSEKAMLEQIRWTQAEYELLREEILRKGSGGRAQRRAAGSRNVVPLCLTADVRTRRLHCLRARACR